MNSVIKTKYNGNVPVQGITEWLKSWRSNIFSENLILNLKFNFVQPYAHSVPLYYQSIYINYWCVINSYTKPCI